MHRGMLALTATDLQVLHGLFNKAAKRRYYGTPVKTEFSNEIAIRLILGCVEFCCWEIRYFISTTVC